MVPKVFATHPPHGFRSGKMLLGSPGGSPGASVKGADGAECLARLGRKAAMISQGRLATAETADKDTIEPKRGIGAAAKGASVNPVGGPKDRPAAARERTRPCRAIRSERDRPKRCWHPGKCGSPDSAGSGNPDHSRNTISRGREVSRRGILGDGGADLGSWPRHVRQALPVGTFAPTTSPDTRR
jgi:hypothetical protein